MPLLEVEEMEAGDERKQEQSCGKAAER